MGVILPENNAYMPYVDNDHEKLQTMPYFFSDEIASKPYNHNWGNVLLIGLYFTAGSNQTSRLDIKIDKYILLLLFFLFQSLKLV